MLQTLPQSVPNQSNRQLILVVEDEAVSRRALAMLLSYSGYAVKAVSSAEHALEFLSHQSDPVIALVDFNLDSMDGLELIHRMREGGLCSASILVTATGDENIRELAQQKSIPFLRKPISLRQLLALVDTNVSGA